MDQATITDVYLEDCGQPIQGECLVDGERLLFQRADKGDAILLFRLQPDEWLRIDTPPTRDADFAALRAVHILMIRRGHICAGTMAGEEICLSSRFEREVKP